MRFRRRRPLHLIGLGAALLGLTAAWGGGAPALPAPSPPAGSPTPPPGPPNIVLILADDMGYGDLGSFGAPLIRTPNLDRLAAEGVRLTDFRVPSALCTPSRGALMTGLYPPRTGLVGNLPSGSPTEGISDGIDDDEITVAQALRERGYATAMVGKWHLGSTLPHLPTAHGFDSYFGISNGDQTFLLLRGTTPVKDPPGLDQITKAYTEEAVTIIRDAARDKPFFLYLAHRSPHVPLEPAPEFLGRSAGGQLTPTRTYYGADLTPLLSGEVSRLPGPGMDRSREMLGYYFSDAVSLRSGRWKFLRPGYWDLVDTLYDLQADPSETTDLYPTRRDLAAPLAERLAFLADQIARGSKKPKKGGGPD